MLQEPLGKGEEGVVPSAPEMVEEILGGGLGGGAEGQSVAEATT